MKGSFLRLLPSGVTFLVNLLPQNGACSLRVIPGLQLVACVWLGASPRGTRPQWGSHCLS